MTYFVPILGPVARRDMDGVQACSRALKFMREPRSSGRTRADATDDSVSIALTGEAKIVIDLQA